MLPVAESQILTEDCNARTTPRSNSRFLLLPTARSTSREFRASRKIHHTPFPLSLSHTLKDWETRYRMKDRAGSRCTAYSGLRSVHVFQVLNNSPEYLSVGIRDFLSRPTVSNIGYRFGCRRSEGRPLFAFRLWVVFLGIIP